MERREFMSMVVGAGIAMGGPFRTGADAGQVPGAPSNVRVRDTKALLDPSDFTYLGYYQTNFSADFSYGMGLAHRYVNGQFRLLMLGHEAAPTPVSMKLYEMVPPALNGDAYSFSSSWADALGGMYGSAGGQFFGLYCHQATGRLFITGAIDYPDDAQSVATEFLVPVTLNANGSSSVQGKFGIPGIGARAVYGGVTDVPAWFQTQYGTGPFACGFGGYTSRMSQGLGSSLGPMLVTFADPAGLPNGTPITDGVRILMDHRGGTRGEDWYTGKSATSPSSYDRGVRNTSYVNYYDGGSYPSPAVPGQWNTAPDGLGRWTWGDSAYQNGVWIDLPDKHGFLLCPVVHTGNTWYQNSTLNFDGKFVEWQMFDPYQFGEVAQGTRPPWHVKPAWRRDQSYNVEASATRGGVGNGPHPGLCATCFDRTTKRLYQRYTFAAGQWPYPKDRIFVWQINA